MKALKMYFKTDEELKILDDFKKSGESQQSYFTKLAIKALGIDLEKREKVIHENYPSIQVRLDNTIHELLKEKSNILNISISEMIIKAGENNENS